MSLSRILNTARTALQAQRYAMSVTANNIANASTPGYSRQRVSLRSYGAGGFSGVRALDVSRIRDPFLDASYRRESSGLASSTTARSFLSRVEGAVNEPSDVGVAAAIDNFFNSFSDLAGDPTGGVAREEVRRAGRDLVDRLNRLDESIREASVHAEQRMRVETDRVNEITRQLADLNAAIASAGGEAGVDPGLLDQRDLFLDELSEYLPLETARADDGTVTVATDGLTLVSGSTHRELTVEPLGEGYGVSLGGDPIGPSGGSLGALATLTGDSLPGYRARLDALAETLVSEVNQLHSQGRTGDGRTGVMFFDPNGTTAGTLALSDDILNSTESIASGRTSASGNSLALDMAAMSELSIDGLDGATFSGHYARFAAGLGGDVRGSMESEAAGQALVDRADSWRQSVSGVSVEEEMVTLVEQQEAFSAAARLVGVADQMVQEILGLIR